MSETPISDKAAEFIHDRGMTEWVPVEVSRQIEKRLAKVTEFVLSRAGEVLGVLAIVGPSKYRIESLSAESDRPYDLTISGKMNHRVDGDTKDSWCEFSAWLPLMAIRDGLNWCSRAVADMTDYPEMVLSGDWSGVRDSSKEAIWAIFERFVLPRIDKKKAVSEE